MDTPPCPNANPKPSQREKPSRRGDRDAAEIRYVLANLYPSPLQLYRYLLIWAGFTGRWQRCPARTCKKRKRCTGGPRGSFTALGRPRCLSEPEADQAATEYIEVWVSGRARHLARLCGESEHLCGTQEQLCGASESD